MNKAIKISNTIVSILLSFLILIGLTSVANASVNGNNELAPCYINITDKNESITISSIKATCSANMSTNRTMRLTIKMELQKKKSNGYETVKTWTSSKTGTTLSMSESRNINALCTYRLKVTYTAGSEQVVAYKY